VIHVHFLDLLHLLQILRQIQIIDIITGTLSYIFHIAPTQRCQVANDHKEALTLLPCVKPITVTEDQVVKSKEQLNQKYPSIDIFQTEDGPPVWRLSIDGGHLFKQAFIIGQPYYHINILRVREHQGNRPGVNIQTVLHIEAPLHGLDDPQYCKHQTKTNHY
jgi:hypothetical protein